ncbi:MAG TPA: hypothetical protein V6D03_01405, partial [Candidatus Caenarcaniphilales bacterium]
MDYPQEPLSHLPRWQPNPDASFRQEVERLHQLSVLGRWRTIGLIWLTIGTLSLWALRTEISLWIDYFTWAAVRYAIIYNRFPALGIAFCLGMTVATLVWQSRNILLGRPRR